MAIVSMSCYSKALCRPTEIRLALPVDVRPGAPRCEASYARPPKLMVLLHGYTGSCNDYLYSSPMHDLAQRFNLVIACPSGENSFYLNQPGTGRAYGDYVGDELVCMLRYAYRVDDAPGSALIAGFSMGGFGALHVGLSHPEHFGQIVALSSALITYQVANMRPGEATNALADYDYYASTFGDPAQVLGSRNHPETLVREQLAAGVKLPELFMACGTEDFLLEPNRRFSDFLLSQGIPVSYHESPGVHDGVFCNRYLDIGVRWALRNETGERT